MKRWFLLIAIVVLVVAGIVALLFTQGEEEAREAVIGGVIDTPDPEPIEALPPETGGVEAIVMEPMIVMEEPVAEELPDEVITGELAFDDAFSEVESGKDLVQVYYGTNRVLLMDEAGAQIETEFPEGVYGELPGVLRYGKALIVIPPRHDPGRLETPLAGRATNEKRYVVLRTLQQSSYETVMAEVQAELARTEDKRTIVAYVHGFNTSFNKAARRAGQLKYDLGFTGPFFFFSWPSKTSAFGYTHAANLAEISYTQMTEFLADLARQDADRIIIIAHSMGTRVLTQGLVDLAAQDPQAAAKITKVILAAPDIDQRVFKERLLPKLGFLKNPITLYASDKDTALAASKEVNGLRRLGDASGGLKEIGNVIMIDASDVKSNLLNHTYFGDSVSIVDDFKSIISGPIAAKDRVKTLTRLAQEPQQLWKVKP
tara:strand:- start:33697 stop:34986 length:1290 start_codon:yes stop_codon:yes gene_type:complete